MKNEQKENNNKVSNWIVRIALFILSVAILTYFFPRQGIIKYEFHEGRPWAYNLLTAPFDFPIYKDDATLQQERDSILRDFRPIYHYDTIVAQKMIADFDLAITNNTQWKVGQTTHNKLITLLQNVYHTGIITTENLNALNKNNTTAIRLLENNIAKNKNISELITPKMAYEYIVNQFPDTYTRHIIQSSNLNSFLVANVLYDSITSQKVRDEYLQNISRSEGLVQAGERIVDRGEIVTPEIYRILTSYETTLAKNNSDNTNYTQYTVVGQIIVFGCIIAFLFVFMAFFRPYIWNNNRAVTLIMLLVTALSAVTFIVSNRGVDAIYLVPLTIAPIIIVTFFDSRTAMYVHIITTIICSFTASQPMLFVFLQMTAGMAVIDSLNNLSKRSELFRCTVIVFVIYALTYAGFTLFTEGDISKLSTSMMINLGINSVLLLFSYLLIYIFERTFGFLSSVTLVELSDINTPLLLRLSEEAPGTFQHAMQVSNLAAAAANRLRANAQLVRTGALYHDIGKLANPAFFTENQSGADSPHKNLALEESAHIIISHVKDGLKMAEKESLPPQVREFIATHHGHGKAKYFYNTYCNQHPGEPVDEEKFTYPGHNPQTKETGILMMADAVEAASRSLKEYNRESISRLVNNIIDTQIADGLLKETPLSFRDVEDIKNIFTDKLMTIYHTRIAYPTLNKQEEKK